MTTSLFNKIADIYKPLIINIGRVKGKLNNNKYIRDCIEIGPYTYGKPKIINYGQVSKIRIGKFCSISKNVTIILDADHRSDWVSTYPFSSFYNTWPNAKNVTGHPFGKGDVIIENDVWLGYGSTILSGVKIGDGAVIAAGTLVTSDVEPYSIVGGIPSRLIKKRFDDERIKQLLEMKWWNWDKNEINKNIPILCSNNLNGFIKRNL